MNGSTNRQQLSLYLRKADNYLSDSTHTLYCVIYIRDSGHAKHADCACSNESNQSIEPVSEHIYTHMFEDLDPDCFTACPSFYYCMYNLFQHEIWIAFPRIYCTHTVEWTKTELTCRWLKIHRDASVRFDIVLLIFFKWTIRNKKKMFNFGDDL